MSAPTPKPSRPQTSLEASEEKYRTLFEAIDEGFTIVEVLFDGDGTASDYRFLEINPAFERQTGIENAAGMRMREIAPEHEQFWFETYGRVALTGEPIRFEHRAEALGRWFDVYALRIGEPERRHGAILFTDITTRKHMEEELVAVAARNTRIAETLQSSMLQAPPTDRFPHVEIKTLYEAALQEANVGGDFFDAFACGPERIALVVGDVSGKGLVAAARTAEIKYALRAFLHAYPSPEIALGRLNDFICETHRLDEDNREAFIVLALAVLDTATGEVLLSAAGAEPTLILRLDGKAEPVEIAGRPLGIAPDTDYTLRSVPLASGETVVMATDGITEARRGRQFLGTEGLASLAEQAGPAISLMGLSQSIYDGARRFAGGGLRDDVCLLLARRH